jgi:hypothetical protein
MRVRLTAQDLTSGKLTQAFPLLIEGREARREEGKKASTNSLECYY